MPTFNTFGDLAFMKRDLSKKSGVTVAITFNQDTRSLRLSYPEVVAAHLGGAGTSLSFSLRGRTVCVSPVRSPTKRLPLICKTNERATVDYQTSTNTLGIRGLSQGMTQLQAALEYDEGVPTVCFDLPSNLTVPDQPDLFKHPFATMSKEGILESLRSAMLEAEAYGLSDWEIDGGRLFAAAAVTQKTRIG